LCYASADPIRFQEYPLTSKSASTAQNEPQGAPAPGPDRDHTPLEDMILHRLDDEKAQDIVFIDLKGQSAFADSLVIATGRSQRHVGAMADHMLRTLKDAGHGRARVEGLPACDWVLIDAGDVIVHLFRPEVREYYNIEKIWSVGSAHRTPLG